MFTDALYYPYIHIPDNLWLRRAILYWDKISPIVPYDVESQIPDNHVSKQLREEGSLEFINPEEILYHDEGRELSNMFLDLMNSDLIKEKIPPVGERDYTQRIHRDKFSMGILTEFEKLKLYNQDKGNPRWLLFELNAATIYMGFLASAIARKKSIEPITDDKLYHDGFMLSQISPSKNVTSIISLVFDNLLPVPVEEIPVKDLIRFKRKHERELLAFRKVIRNILMSVSNVTDENEIKTLLEGYKDNLKESMLIIDKKLSENKIRTIFNLLESSLKLSVPEAAVVAGAASIAVPLGAIAFGTNAAIKIGKVLFEGRVAKHSILESNPYTYLYSVRKELI